VSSQGSKIETHLQEILTVATRSFLPPSLSPSSDAAPGISKAEAAELEASWQQQARDLEEWAARGGTEGGLEGGQAAYGFADENEFMDHGDAFAEG